MLRNRLLLQLLAWSVLSGAMVSAQNQKEDDHVDYISQIKPIFAKHCFSCHAAIQQKSGLRLDTVAAIHKGGQQGNAIVPGHPEKSLLLDAITGQGAASKMPPEGDGTPLTDGEIAIVKRWISQGATGPTDERPQPDPREFWSYQSPQRPVVPDVANAGWVLNPVDAFIAAEHQKRGLTPRPAAERAVWLRRVYLDLIGIPPTRDEFQAFLQDESPLAFEKVVDELLQRPQYGERWGRHWMDVWRYSDWYGSRGINEIRYSQRHIWRWRDWIVDSLNHDKGYDRMIVEMLAGDELEPSNPDVLRATGFLGRNWYKFDRNVWLFDTVEHTSQAFLGVTLKCCRCHDHKYDPISQEDYYRFRAFFEPHDVRVDRLSATTETEKDATLGQVLKDGVARVYDKVVDAKTHVFQRGDDRSPDEKRIMEPAVPAALSHESVKLAQIPLPLSAYYPMLRPDIVEGLLDQVRARITAADQEIAQAQSKLEAAQDKLRQAETLAQTSEKTKQESSTAPGDLFYDDFAKPRPDAWQMTSGNWVYENGHLTQKAIGEFQTMASKIQLPSDFTARLKYRPLAPGTLRSIGFSFDYVDGGNSQDVYTHLNDASQGIQAFHRLNGSQVYPAEGIVRTDGVLKVGEVATVEIIARGQSLTLSLNGSKKLDYIMPAPRRTGTFSIWCHLGTAEFVELQIRDLVPTLDDLRRTHQRAVDALALSQQKRFRVVAELESLQARVAAERAKFGNQPEDVVRAAGLAASRAEKSVGVLLAQENVLLAEQALAHAKWVAVPGSKAPEPTTVIPTPGVGTAPDPKAGQVAAVSDAEKKLEAARQALQTAQKTVENGDGKYTPLGELFPTVSTGRRLALARWITQRQNPRTARIAVNHIWLRHFGQALVPTVANFGLNGERPSHPELLDWLAVEFMDQGWRMKPIHRLLVLSNTYRMSSASTQGDESNYRLDKNNLFLWRMNSRRMEAETVRDSVLAVTRSLDLRTGGPEIPESEGQNVFRRSLYFRLTPNEKMKFLEVFDAADPNACYRRRESVVPNQALALMNSSLALDQSRALADALSQHVGESDTAATNRAFIQAAFEQILTATPRAEEISACEEFLKRNTALVQETGQTPFAAGGQSKRQPATQPHLHARENLVHVLISHNAFVTIR